MVLTKRLRLGDEHSGILCRQPRQAILQRNFRCSKPRLNASLRGEIVSFRFAHSLFTFAEKSKIMAINTSTITKLISDFRALSQKDSISPESLGSRREPWPQRFPQGQRRRKTCRIGRRPPRNIVPTRAKLSLLKLCRVQPILCNTAPTAPTLSIHSTSVARNFHIETLSA